MLITRPSPLGPQGGQQRLGDVQGAEHVDVVHRGPVVGIGTLDGVGAEGAAGVVDQHVQHRPDPLGQGRDGRTVGDVTGRGDAADLVGEGLDPVRTAGGAVHQEPLGREPSRRGGADAAAGAGDEGDTTWRGHAAIVPRRLPRQTGRHVGGLRDGPGAVACRQARRRAAQVVGLLGGLAWVVAAFLWEGGDDPVELGLFWVGRGADHAVPPRAGHAAGQARPARAAAVRGLRAAVAVLDGRRLRRLVGIRRRHRLGDRGGRGRGCSRSCSWRGRPRSAPRSEEPSRLAGLSPARKLAEKSARRESPAYLRGWALWRSPPTGRHARGVTRSRRDDQPAHLPARPAGDRRRRRHERLRDGAVQAARAAGHRGRHLHPGHLLGAADGARGGARRAGPQHPRRPVRGPDQGRAARPDVRVRPRGAARRGLPAAGPLLRAALPLLALRPGRGVGPRPLGRARSCTRCTPWPRSRTTRSPRATPPSPPPGSSARSRWSRPPTS